MLDGCWSSSIEYPGFLWPIDVKHRHIRCVMTWHRIAPFKIVFSTSLRYYTERMSTKKSYEALAGRSGKKKLRGIGGFMEPKIRLLDQMRNVMRLKHMSLRTEEAYVSWVRRFILFHDKRHPGDMGAEEIRAFLTHLAVQGRVAAFTPRRTAPSMLWFFFIVMYCDCHFRNLQALSAPNVHAVSLLFLPLKRRRLCSWNSAARPGSWRDCSMGQDCVSWNAYTCA